MTKNKILAALMLTLLLALIAPIVHAQSGRSQDLGQQILAYLGPRRGQWWWDVFFIYPIFFFALVTLFMQGDKELTTTLIMATVLLLTVVSKLAPLRVLENLVEDGDPFVFGYPNGLIIFVIHCGIFVFPLIVAGMTRAKKSRMPAIITGVLGGVYLFGFWFFVQRLGYIPPDRMMLPFM
jgi:hypothetical protein